MQVEESDQQRYQPSRTYVVERTAEGALALSSEQRLRLLDQCLKFILFFGAGEVPEGLAGCAELGVWRFTQSSGAAKDYPFIYGLCRRHAYVGALPRVSNASIIMNENGCCSTTNFV
jgi:hypothetical protein